MLYLLNSITFGISISTNLVQPLKAESSIVDTMDSLHEINSCLLKNAFSGTSFEEIIIPKEVVRIEKNAFYLTKIESLTIPSDVSELKRGWCCGTAPKKINISNFLIVN